MCRGEIEALRSLQLRRRSSPNNRRSRHSNPSAENLLTEMVETNTEHSTGSTTRLAESLAARFHAAGFPAVDVQVVGPDTGAARSRRSRSIPTTGSPTATRATTCGRCPHGRLLVRRALAARPSASLRARHPLYGGEIWTQRPASRAR